ncbi:PD-(D/E)XK nuclease family protein [Clostridium sp. BL-8]|uniref:PD-(D/E)XK nuclease family protein n=1 Tax=Clostridium sp. BL-8 TaxID=349938 RepID=UPI00098C9EEA|nr:PD-(D/E)XK nuclease family protein [Clostridium sp. BL-8]OOM78808.1 ATP-dependent helicase/deoxyribonuclease subunit B [Clostridium sp. BL-8]
MIRELHYLPLYTNSREQLIEHSINAIKKGKKVIYIAPSREVMFDVRNRVIGMLGGLMNITICGFDDLEMEIFERSNNNLTVISKDEAAILLTRIIDKLSEDRKLQSLKVEDNLSGLVNSIYDLIKLFKRQAITPEKFQKIIDQFKNNTVDNYTINKFVDIYNIYELYRRELISLKLTDVDDRSFIACEEIGKCGIMDGVEEFIIDGFINIDPINVSLIKTIMESFSEINLRCSVPFRTDSTEAFLEENIVKDLLGLGFIEKEQISTSELLIDPSIRVLSQGLFNLSTERISKGESIAILNAPCIEDEVRQTAREIKKLVMEEKESLENIAIVVNDAEQYEDYMIEVFKELGIKLDYIQNKSISSHPIFRLVIEILHLVEQAEANNFIDKEKFVDIILSPYFNFYQSSKETAKEYLYVVKNLKDTVNYEASLEKIINNIKSTGESKDMVEYEFKLETITQVKEIINFFYKSNNDFPREAIAKECFEFCIKIIDSFMIAQKIKDLYKEKCDIMFYRENIEVYRQILNIFERANEILALTKTDENISCSRYIELIENIANSAHYTVFSGANGGVKVIEPDLLRGVNFDFIFVLGLNEGAYPKLNQKHLILSSVELELIRNYGIRLEDLDWELQREKVRFILTCSSAVKGLYLSYRTAEEDGGYMIKSGFLDEVQSAFSETAIENIVKPKIAMRNRFDFNSKAVWSPNELNKNILKGIWQERDYNVSCVSQNYNSLVEEHKQNLGVIIQLGKIEHSRDYYKKYNEFDGRLSNEIDLNSLGHFSASKINTYKKCPFKFYLQNMLKLNNFEEEEDLDPRSRGTLIHSILEMYYRCGDSNGIYDAETEKYAVNEEWLRNCIDKAIAKAGFTSLNDFVLKQYCEELFNKLGSFVEKDSQMLNNYKSQKNAILRPYIFELGFKDSESFAPYTFKGFIDRIDLEFNNDGKFTGNFVIYDYKGSVDSKFKDSVTGKDLQLTIYYFIIMRLLKEGFEYEKQWIKHDNPKCLGLFYYSYKDKHVTAKIDDYSKEGMYLDVCQDILTHKRDSMNKLSFDTLIQLLSSKIYEAIKNIESGNFTLPFECSSYDNEFISCEFSHICRYNEQRLEIKIKEVE